jgi:hypothetical protein
MHQDQALGCTGDSLQALEVLKGIDELAFQHSIPIRIAQLEDCTILARTEEEDNFVTVEALLGGDACSVCASVWITHYL